MNRKTLMKFTRTFLLGLVSLVLLLGMMASISLATTATETYIIRSGETLASIASDHGISLDELLALNPSITNPNMIYVGQAIKVPGEEEPAEPGTSTAICAKSYTTQAGDTWASIATANNVEANILAIVNNMAVDDTLATGTELCLPVPPTSEPVTEPKPAPETMPKPTPAPTPMPVPTQLPKPGEGPGQWYVIQRGDYLSRVALRHSCTTRVLSEVNSISNPSRIFRGQRVWIPANCTALIKFLPAVPRYVPPPAPRPAPAPVRAPAPPPPPPPTQPAPPPTAPPALPPAPPAPSSGLNYTAPTHGPWTGQYFSNPSLNGSAAVTRQDSKVVFSWGQNSPAAGLPNDGFSVRWTTRAFFTGATYRFIALADDGVRVWVDNNLVIDGWQDQSQTLYHAEYRPQYGNHDVRVEYYDSRADATIVVNWAPTR